MKSIIIKIDHDVDSLATKQESFRLKQFSLFGPSKTGQILKNNSLNFTNSRYEESEFLSRTIKKSVQLAFKGRYDRFIS